MKLDFHYSTAKILDAIHSPSFAKDNINLHLAVLEKQEEKLANHLVLEPNSFISELNLELKSCMENIKNVIDTSGIEDNKISLTALVHEIQKLCELINNNL